MLSLEKIVDSLPKRCALYACPRELQIEAIERRLRGDTHESISQWLRDTHSISISAMALWKTFARCIPDMVLKMRKNMIPSTESEVEGIQRQIENLEQMAEIQLERLKTQYYDELTQEGMERFNPQTGEIDYSGTNKHFNDSIRAYNQTIKNIIELKMAVGLVKKQPDAVDVRHYNMTPDAAKVSLKDVVVQALVVGPEIQKFIQENSEPKKKEVIDAEVVEIVEETTESNSEIPG